MDATFVQIELRLFCHTYFIYEKNNKDRYRYNKDHMSIQCEALVYPYRDR